MAAKKALTKIELLKFPTAKPGRRKARLAGEVATVGGQVDLLRKMASGLLGEVEECDEDIEDRGDNFDFEGENPTAIAALEAVLDLPPVPASLASLPVQCPRLDWGRLRDRAKAIGDQLEVIQEAVGDREAGEFGDALDETLGWFNEF